MAHTQGTRSRRRSGEIQARSLTFIAQPVKKESVFLLPPLPCRLNKVHTAKCVLISIFCSTGPRNMHYLRGEQN